VTGGRATESADIPYRLLTTPTIYRSTNRSVDIRIWRTSHRTYTVLLETKYSYSNVTYLEPRRGWWQILDVPSNFIVHSHPSIPFVANWPRPVV